MRLAAFHLQAIGPDEFRLVLERQEGGQQVLVLSYAQVRELAQAATEAAFALPGAVSWQPEPEWTGAGWQLGAARRPGA